MRHDPTPTTTTKMKKRLTMPNVGRDEEHPELSYVVDRSINWHNDFGELVLFLRVEHTPTLCDGGV